MDKILEALKKLLPQESLNEVATAVQEVLDESKKELDAEFTSKLEEAYSELSAQLAEAEKIAYQGYAEAAGVIQEGRELQDNMREEYERELEKGYAEAYEMVKSAKAEKNAVEIDIHDQYDAKLNQMKEYVVDKLDQFLQFRGGDIYGQAKRDILSDPRFAEQKVVLDKIVEVASDYLSAEDYNVVTSAKLENAAKSIEELKAQIHLMEHRNIRLANENNKLNESMRQHKDVLNENKNNEKKERAQKAKNVSGRGTVVEGDQTKVIAEHSAPAKATVQEDTSLLESIGLDRDTVNLLAGTKKQQ